ncbi:MAG: multicopper oxidase domain-containing protein [Thermoleophilia bacterium]|nr:multicopper oxidase domain-containing protein [Thermoleophilia bacterium]
MRSVLRRVVVARTPSVTLVTSGLLVTAAIGLLVSTALLHEPVALEAGSAHAATLDARGASTLGPAPTTLRVLTSPKGRAQRLYIPPLVRPTIDSDGTKVFHLTARQGTVTRLGERLETAGYNGVYLAPTIRARRGERMRVEITNAMRETTTVHWHGLHVPARYDGGPYQLIPPGTTWRPEWTLNQLATTLWYHPHVMGQTAQQVGHGMAGMFIVDDPRGTQRRLPRRYGVDDIPVILQGAPLPVGGGSADRRPLLVNGTPNALLRTAQGRLRLRLLNATGGAMLGVNVRGARHVYQVGSDGGLLPVRAGGGRVVLGPSERAELVVDLRPGSHVQMRTSLLPDRGAGSGTSRVDYLRGRENAGDTGTVLTIANTARRLRAQRAIPRRLAATPAIDLTNAHAREMVLGPGIEINGRLMQDADHGAFMDGTVEIPLGQTEVWTIRNISPFTHVFHVHDIEFQVLDRDGRRPDASERGWKDSILVPPGHTARIAMTFTDYADPLSPYMFHCHVLRHEDGGMMGQFIVVPPSGG